MEQTNLQEINIGSAETHGETTGEITVSSNFLEEKRNQILVFK